MSVLESISRSFNLGTGLASGGNAVNVCGMYLVDVTKCTKNINTEKDNLGKNEIILIAYGTFYTDSSWTFTYQLFCIPIIGNLLLFKTHTTGDPLAIQNFYGCSAEDIQELTLDQYYDYLESDLVKYHIEMEMSDATKINYSDGTYDIIRDVLTESQAKDYAYQQLLNTYGSFYKATESEMNSQLNKMSS